SKGEGVEELLTRLDEHREYLIGTGGIEEARRRRVRAEVTAVLGERLRRSLAAHEAHAVDAVLSGRLGPGEVVDGLLAGLSKDTAR
ncbi:MAG TPA: hypothetical protein PLG36_05630, partial [Trueperaceae bacterium]|nr:hypothetical protein [Trueperaceae bacterium]